MKRKLLLICFIFTGLSGPVFSQKKNLKKIYCAAIRYYYTYNDTSQNILIADSTLNRDIIEVDYSTIAFFPENNNGFVVNRLKLDSSWKPILKSAEAKKKKLKNGKFPVLCINKSTVNIIRKTEAENFLRDSGWFEFKRKFNTNDYLIFSEVLFLKDKAILELTRQSEILNAETRIFFLEKKDGIWQVVASLQTRIS